MNTGIFAVCIILGMILYLTSITAAKKDWTCFYPLIMALCGWILVLLYKLHCILP